MRVFSEKHRKNLSKNHTNVSGKNNPFYGKHHSKKFREKLSGIKKGKPSNSPTKFKKGHATWNKGLRGVQAKENHPNWKGGICSEMYLLRRSYEYGIWRNSVFERDNYVCQACGKRGDELNAHHILSFRDFPHKRFDISNGITLCKKCHRKLHKKGE